MLHGEARIFDGRDLHAEGARLADISHEPSVRSELQPSGIDQVQTGLKSLSSVSDQLTAGIVRDLKRLQKTVSYCQRPPIRFKFMEDDPRLFCLNVINRFTVGEVAVTTD